MGDMADMLLEQIEDYEESVAAFRTGRISTDEAHEMGIIDELGYEATPTTGSAPSGVVCLCCKQRGLRWLQSTGGKWLLHTIDGRLHACPVNPILLPEGDSSQGTILE